MFFAEPSRARAQLLWNRTRRYGFVLVPIVALWELLAHGSNLAHVATAREWRAAHDYIAQHRQATDVVASAPLWTDPLARMYFADLISLDDAARPDATRYGRAFVATVRGGQHPDFDGWPEANRARFGDVTVRVLRNPHPAVVLYDFVNHLHPPDAHVAREDRAGERACDYHAGLSVGGGRLGQGAIAGPERYLCGPDWNYVGRVIAEDMDHRGRQCIWSHPVVDAPMRTTFTDVPIGNVIRGHHVIAYEAERGGDHYETGAPVVLTVRVGGREVGSDWHIDGQGWKLFQFDTHTMAGSRQDVTFEVTTPWGGNRHYCFQADSR